jgi:H+/Na+-translocating ferredoxin:NAD+ oxidoreductase subunit G
VNGRRPWLRVALPVVVLSAACAALLVTVHRFTAARIERNMNMETIRLLDEVMPVQHDNDMIEDAIPVPELASAAAGTPVHAYRARRNGAPAGLVLLPLPAGGYNGVVELALGITFEGRIAGVRVVRQHETGGLGDQVDQRRSPWILQFTDRSLENTPDDAWAVHSDGGGFDQISGATITPRGVIKAVKGALQYYQVNRETLYR